MSTGSDDLTKSLVGSKPVETDYDFNFSENKKRHEKSYTNILEGYENNITITLKRKLTYKTIVFWVSIALLCVFPALLIWSFFFREVSSMKDACIEILPLLISFLTVYIVIPKVITEYLFNAEEEKYMSDIIKNIQDYDKK